MTKEIVYATASVSTVRDNVIEVQSLHKRYGKIEAVRGIDFTVHRGEIFGLIGPDGAGKTTTFHILGGVMEASSGNIQVLGRKPRDARLKISYLTQQFSLYLDLSINENLQYSAGLRKVPNELFIKRRAKYLKLMELDKIANRLAGQLSGGMKQKLALCCALISEPEILLLDEPTTGVDPVSRREFWDILASLTQEGVTIIVATPYLDEAERCHRIALVYEGKIQEIGYLEELRSSLGLYRFEVRTPDLEAAEAALQELPPRIEQVHLGTGIPAKQIVDVQTFGDRLDVLVKNVKAGEVEIREIMTSRQMQLTSIQEVETTLENIFVTRLRANGSDPPFIQFPRSRPSKYIDSNHINEDAAIDVRNLKKVYSDFKAVESVSLEIRYGEIYGLLGANGAGKTTTIKMLCGLIEPSSGYISLGGQTSNLRSSALRQRIGYMSQKFTLYDDLTILENLEFYCGVYGVPQKLFRPKIDWVLNTCGLVGQENMLTGRLPGGWKQRVAFGASIMHEPDILFLDEPTSGVDPLARRQFWRLICDLARKGTAVLVTTHYLEEAEQCNRLGFMVDGKLVAQGSPSEIKAAQPGQLIELVTKDTQTALNLLKNELDDWRVSIFGTKLHIILNDKNKEIHQIESILNAAQLEILSWRTIPFSLEDTFISIFQSNRQKTQFIQK
jgi:ABC-2 type transport system ATP-binding protein